MSQSEMLTCLHESAQPEKQVREFIVLHLSDNSIIQFWGYDVWIVSLYKTYYCGIQLGSRLRPNHFKYIVKGWIKEFSSQWDFLKTLYLFFYAQKYSLAVCNFFNFSHDECWFPSLFSNRIPIIEFRFLIFF